MYNFKLNINHISDRAMAQIIFKPLVVEESNNLIVDFSQVEFISRSAMHEILSILRDKKIKLVPTYENEVVQTMRELVIHSMDNPVKRIPVTHTINTPVSKIEDALASIF